MASIQGIEGIGPEFAAKLGEAGIRTTEALLERGRTRRGRAEIAEQTGIGDARILEWVNRADLFRVRGIGEQYSDLLEAAGVDTVAELATRNAENLAARLAEVNAERNLVRRTPAAAAVAAWIADATSLPRGVEH